MTWNTKRDGYYQRPVNPNPLGRPVHRLEPYAGHTHAIIIPGTTFRLFMGESYMKPQMKSGKEYPSKCELVLRDLKKSTIAGTGKRRTKAAPVLLTIEEFQSLSTEVKAA